MGKGSGECRGEGREGVGTQQANRWRQPLEMSGRGWGCRSAGGRARTC